MSIKKKLGERITRLRDRASMTQEEVCEASGLSQSYYSQIETGKRNATVETVDQIAKALDTSLERIFKGL